MKEISAAQRFVRNPAVASRIVADQLMLVPVRTDARQDMGLYTLNPSAALLWELADGEHRLADCVDALCQRFEVEPERAAQDLQTLLIDLVDAGLLALT